MFRWRALLIVLFLATLSGCAPQPDGQSDEQNDQFFQLGNRLLRERDYKGAVDAFEKSLELNPRSVAAHYELGLLYENRLNEPAIALYHYKQVLRFRPSGHPAEIVLARTKGCEQEIAKNVALVQVDPAVMAELERLKEENRRLQRDLETMRALASSNVQAYTNAPPLNDPRADTAATSKPNAPQGGDTAYLGRATQTNSLARPLGQIVSRTNNVSQSGGARPGPVNSGVTVNARAFRSHTVRERETFSSIARQHGVGVAALRAANPTVSPERLRPGQLIRVPGR
ncbi:MAG: LysM peptidoglycan-binding domain-containing protein [Verrucomicrobia bacterium]|nr:LysM peptidoglycan-binding domain-containing protein [Verrucomicrobiota bacterium]MBI3870819.1 LysM peptidoglycan-binding domain-containing protein [Verrucomicrobiota bacterium]